MNIVMMKFYGATPRRKARWVVEYNDRSAMYVGAASAAEVLQMFCRDHGMTGSFVGHVLPWIKQYCYCFIREHDTRRVEVKP